MPVPNQYRKGSPYSVGYNFEEISSGVGTVILKGCDTYDDTNGQKFMLTVGSPRGKNGYYERDGTQAWDIDFDTTINIPLLLGGKALINIPTVNKDTAGAFTFSRTYYVSIKKYVDATETVVVSGQVLVTSSMAGANSEFKNIAIPLTVPSTLFVAGDVLRLSIESDNTMGQAFIGTAIGTNPEGTPMITNYGGYTGDLEYAAVTAYLPVKIDL
jgi:hypothetical protein